MHAKGALVCVIANLTALALFTMLKSYVHKMAPRLVDETVDDRGRSQNPT